MNESVRILYVEDEATLAQLVVRRLARLGYQVECAENGETGLERLQKEHFDVLIVDYQLPKMNGLMLLQQLAEHTIDIPSIMVSGQDNISVVVQAMQLNCRDYLVKDGNSYLELLPVHIDTLLARRQLELEKNEAEQQVRYSQASLARAQALAHIGNWEWHVGDTYSWWSDEEYRIFGLEKADFPDGMQLDKFLDLIHPDDRVFIPKLEEYDHDEDASLEYEYRIIRPDGLIRWVHAKTDIECDAQGQMIRWTGTTQDITGRKESEKQLLLAQSVFETTSEAILVTDADQRIISVNPAFTKITGFSKEDVIGKTPRILQSGKHTPQFYKKMWHALLEEGVWAGEIWNRNKDGALYPEWLSITAIYDDNGAIERYVSIFNDITQHKEAEQLIEYQANYDALTGLPNRNLFADRLMTAIRVAQRENTRLALLFLDLDRFKWVNDTLGHRAGDLLLKETAQRLTSVLRESDTVSRFGGDEFTVILTDLEQEIDAELIAEKILAALSEPYQLDEQQVFVTTSIGITIYPDDADNAEALYQNADSAMYAAKEAGRNQFSFFTQKMQKQATKRLILLNELREAIDKQQFELYYQPVIDLTNNTLHGAEALIRWNHPEKGLVLPDKFIPLAEETGLISRIGQWVINEALVQIKTWQDAGYEFHISINKSSKQFHSDECAFDLAKQMKVIGVEPQRLSIEITETVLMEHEDWILTMLDNYRKAGIKLSLDDFGTGFSSLSYLRKFPFDVLKIDRCFIMDLTEDNQEAPLVEAIISMGHKLGLRVAAEGVETQQQLDFLRNTECDLIQGYLYSCPISAAEFEQRFFVDQEWIAA